MIGIAMVWTGLFPNQIAALGLTFQTGDRRILIRLFGLVTAYLLTVFVVSALTNLANWRHRFRFACVHFLKQPSTSERDLLDVAIQQALRQVPLRLEAEDKIQFALFSDFIRAKRPQFCVVAYKTAPSAMFKVTALDLGLPVVVGLWAICMLLPLLWIVLACAALYLIGIPLAYRTSKLEIATRSRALAIALASWFYIGRRRMQMG